MLKRPRRLGASIALPAAVLLGLTLAGCGSSGGSSSGTSAAPATTGSTAAAGTGAPATTAAPTTAAPSTPAPTAAGAGAITTRVGVKVVPAFGGSPGLTIPAGKAPATLSAQVLTTGTGKAIAKGDLLVANYLGQTWAPKDGKANVFDSSFSRGPAAFVIGEGQVIAGWDKTLVGKKLGSRVLLTIPPADGYPDGQPSVNIAKTDTLVFVVDLLGAYGPDASAPGTAVSPEPSGLPKIDNTPGKEPKILSTAGVAAPSSPSSTLVVKGSGAPIDDAKTLVLQFVESDLATGKDTQSTWGQAPQAVSAQQVLTVASALKDQRIGARVVVLLPATAAVPGSSSAPSQAAQPPELLVIDVVGQF